MDIRSRQIKEKRRGARSWSSWGVTHLVDELETVLVRLALVGELNRVEREGGRRVEGDDAGSEDGRGLWEERGENWSSGRARRVYFPDTMPPRIAFRGGRARRSRRKSSEIHDVSIVGSGRRVAVAPENPRCARLPVVSGVQLLYPGVMRNRVNSPWPCRTRTP